jgi:hypothetical protein
MLELVLWSCMVGLVPWLVGLARQLISGVARLFSPKLPSGSVGVPGAPAYPADLPRPVTARPQQRLLMLSNDKQ